MRSKFLVSCLLFLFSLLGFSCTLASYSSLFPAFHNYSEILFDAHIAIGENYQDFWDFWNITRVIKDLQRYNTAEISSYWRVSDEWYARASSMYNETRELRKSLVKKLNILKNKELSCRNKKQFYDRKFFTAFEYLWAVSMQDAMDSAIESERCATDSRVKYNAYKTLYDKLVYEEKFFSDRYKYRSVRRYSLKKQ